jgi:ATP-dependent DNA helicase RecG
MKISVARLVKILKKLDLKSERDLLWYFPYRYEDFSNTTKISEIKTGDQVSIKGQVKDIRQVPSIRGRITRTEALVSDQSGSIKVVWFNQPYLANTFKKGDQIFLSGSAGFYKTIQLQNPIYEKLQSENSEQIHTGRILPIYHLSGDLPLRTLRTLIYYAVEKYSADLEETLPTNLLNELNLPSIKQTIKSLHFPDSQEELDKAKLRIAFEEIFTINLAIEKHKNLAQKYQSPAIPFNKTLIQGFIQGLPFELTADQKKAIWDILQDLEKKRPMNRLLEGDVGSGKTLVALISAMEVMHFGIQSVLLCPTEILAQQHYSTAQKYLEPYPRFSIILLTSKTIKINGRIAKRSEALAEIEHGGPQLIISTHAVLQKDVKFDDIGLIIIDEQHRFGVRQRAELKQNKSKLHAHLLSMTATPIPRTLKLALFGDLDITQIKHKPADRKPIATKLVTPNERKAAYNFIDSQIDLGRQIFVVTPLIEESDKLDVKAAETEVKELQKIFPHRKIKVLHGRMKSVEKESIMQAFLAKEIDILVSTAVIEVGVDVPNASVMVIEGAERFGLSQLHQFRGRVGRSEHKSYCLLFSTNENPKSLERLKQFERTLDGFALAEIDLETRGFGNIFGEQQSGFYYFKYFDFAAHKELAQASQTWAKKIISDDPQLNSLRYWKQKIKDRLIHLE